jgi:hypothetical protein
MYINGYVNEEFNPRNMASQEVVTFKLVNQSWFKVLAVLSLLCALFIYAALVWLICCRAHRLPETDESIKRTVLVAEKLKRKRKHRKQRNQLDLKKKLRYLLFGNRRLIPPESSCFESDNESSSDAAADNEDSDNNAEEKSTLVDRPVEKKKRNLFGFK